jgi:hypothetical protein
MDNQAAPECENHIHLAEIDPDLNKAREHVEEAEVAMSYRAMDLDHSSGAQDLPRFDGIQAAVANYLDARYFERLIRL